LVHTSTSEVYGTALYTPIDERHPLQAQSPYSASKISGDKMAESYHRSFGIPVATVRPFNTFGPRQSGRAVIPTIISQALVGDTIRLGALTPMRDLSFVMDTVEGFLAVAGSEGVTGEVVNIGRGEAIAIGDLARMILDILGKKDARIVSDEKRLRPESSEVYELVCDNRKARDLCSWFPRRGLREGLEETIAWIEKHLDRMKAGSYTV
jgi:nucleoside-diphosphate-sugar epimerase